MGTGSDSDAKEDEDSDNGSDSEGDCLFAFKHHGNMWIKIHETLRTNIGFVTVNLPKWINHQKKETTSLHEIIFYTFTTMKDTGKYKPTIDHINRKKNGQPLG